VSPRRGRCLALVVLFVLGTAACSPLQISEPSPVRYQLAPPEDLVVPADLTGLPQSLAVFSPAVAPWLDSDRIMLVLGERRLEHAAGARWATTLPDLLENLTRSTLLAAGGPAAVRAPQVAGGSHALLLQVEGFHAAYPSGRQARPVLHVDLIVSLLDTRSGAILGAARAARRSRAGENRLALIVAGLERLFVEALLEAAASIRPAAVEEAAGRSSLSLPRVYARAGG